MSKKRKDGYFQKTFTFNGKRYSVYAKNKNELFEKEKIKREELESGFSKRNDPTIKEYYERWTNNRRGTVKESTIRGQKKRFKTMADIFISSIDKSFGDIKIKQITIDDLRFIQTELLKERQTQTVNDYMAHLKHCMNNALKERIIDYNPCILLNSLKRTEERARDTYHRALSLDEQKKFFFSDKCKKSYYYNVFRIAVLTGMRVGEIGALKYSDIRDNCICVERTITRGESGGYIIGESAKTDAGRRNIPINEKIQNVIEDQYNLNRLLNREENELLFLAPENGLLMATPIDREIKRICEDCKIKPFTMHALRATFATRAIESNMNPKTLQEILGHTNFNLTMSLYGHAMIDTKKQEMDAIKIVV